MKTEYKTIKFNVQDGICIIKFNRPDVLNAINVDLLEEFEAALNRIRENENILVLVLTGEGEKAFVAGADISIMEHFTPLQAKRFTENGQRILFLLESLPIPVIACVNGFALGGGNEIAMACDFIYASETAKFGQPEINLAVIPGFGGTQRLPRLVGTGQALELCLTGKIINAQEARDIGLVNRVLPADQLWEETMKVASSLATKGRVAIRALKASILSGIERDIQVGCQIESDAFALCFSGSDAGEGMRAFLEKRKPELKDKI